MSHFDTVLIANRGAIARRIARSCRELGLKVVMVYADDDCQPELLTLADEAILIPDIDDRPGYLNAQAIIAAALERQAAVHPGYGFLAEDADFAHAVRAAGLVWIGPSPEVLRLSGDKAACAAAVQAAGLPLLPSLPCSDATPETINALTELGLPLLLKPAHGGGGIGMRLVHDPAELGEALTSCLDQARRHFGVATILAERWLPAARHIEVQLLADAQGARAHLFERECSLQRRRQKVLEEGPSPALDQAQREALYALALDAAAAIGLDQVATAEFLFDGARFWFLEINPRIQVEHAVTELITGVDLVECQLRIAAGTPLAGLGLPSGRNGHAVEVRLYAEHPWTGLPAAGEIHELGLPDGHGLRLELGVCAGMKVSSRYDPLLLKLIAHGPDRARAIARLRTGLSQLALSGSSGFATNQPALSRVLAEPGFLAGDYDTATLEALPPEPAGEAEDLAALVRGLSDLQRRPQITTGSTGPASGRFWRPAWT